MRFGVYLGCVFVVVFFSKKCASCGLTPFHFKDSCVEYATRFKFLCIKEKKSEMSDGQMPKNHGENDVATVGQDKSLLCIDCGKNVSNGVSQEGRASSFSKYPWNVQLVLNDHKIELCGGSIITDRYVLTAAQCVEFLHSKDLRIRLGFERSTEDGLLPVHSIQVHEKFSANDVTQNDIALIKLKSPLKFSEEFWPICLPKKKFYHLKKGLVTYWENYDGEDESLMQTGEVRVHEIRHCRGISSYRKNELHPRVVCGLGKDPNFKGETGSPLVHFDGEKYTQIGILSWQIGNSPVIYTRVPAFFDWIQRRTRDSAYCDP